MQTIQLQVEDDIYDEIKSKGIDINHKLQDFLYDLLDDGYPSVSEDEAKQRVSDAVDRYRNGTGSYTNAEEYLEYKSNMIDTIKSKYANN
ncbi:MAG: hypothetical protein U9Q33_10420 [Campylobacterota bacterium]|nr:hypothetical protein [Campylobacterota bacterium]